MILHVIMISAEVFYFYKNMDPTNCLIKKTSFKYQPQAQQYVPTQILP